MPEIKVTGDDVLNVLNLSGRGWKAQGQDLDIQRSPGGGWGEIKEFADVYTKNGVKLELWWTAPLTISRYVIDGKEGQAETLNQLVKDIEKAGKKNA